MAQQHTDDLPPHLIAHLRGFASARGGQRPTDDEIRGETREILGTIRKEKDEQMRKYGRHLSREEEFDMEERQLRAERERVIMNDFDDDYDSPKSSKFCCCIVM